MRDGKPGLADCVRCVAASTSLGMTKLENLTAYLGNTLSTFAIQESVDD
jgi:hypothetical protein